MQANSLTSSRLKAHTASVPEPSEAAETGPNEGDVTVGLVSAVEQRPATVFAAFSALHLFVWSALPAALYPNLPLDLIEALTYGREWQLGYDKLPPLPWWLVETVHRLFGADLFYYVLAQAAVLIGFACVWAMARRLTSATGALVALLILDGLHYVHFTAAKFNHDVIQLPFWVLAGYAYWAALRRGRVVHWLLLGFALGIALWAKYFVVVLAAPLALFALVDRDARKCLATPGPYVATLVALLIASPHVWWLVQNDFLPFRYADARAVASRGWIDHIWHPLQFAIGQFAFMLPALIIAIPLVLPRGEKAGGAADAFDRRIVTVLAFGPALTVIALSLVSGRGTIAMWGYPLWMFLGLWAVLVPGRALDRLRFVKVATTWAIVFAIFAAVFIASDHANLRRPLSRGVLSRRQTWHGIVDALPRADAASVDLRDRLDVGWRQRRALFAGSPARLDRRPAEPCALDRSRRHAGEGRGDRLDFGRWRRASLAARIPLGRRIRRSAGAVHAAVSARRGGRGWRPEEARRARASAA